MYSSELIRVLRGSWQSSGSIPCGWWRRMLESRDLARVETGRYLQRHPHLPTAHRAARGPPPALTNYNTWPVISRHWVGILLLNVIPCSNDGLQVCVSMSCWVGFHDNLAGVMCLWRCYCITHYTLAPIMSPIKSDYSITQPPAQHPPVHSRRHLYWVEGQKIHKIIDPV